MKKLFTAFLLSFTLVNFAFAADTQATSPQTATFKDLQNTHSNYVAIKYMVSQGVFKGYDDGTFKPDQLVKRAEALKVILSLVKTEIPATVEQVPFKDMKVVDWFVPYVAKAKELAIVQGRPDGTFGPASNVQRAEFLKMLLLANGFNPEKWASATIFADVPKEAWFAPYMNYAGQAGLLVKDANNNLLPSKELTRGEVAEIMYLLTVIRKGNETQFLIDQAKAEMDQIDPYVGASNPTAAKRASELAVDISQQAMKNLPDNNVVLGVAKLARAYDFLVNSYISALQKKNEEAKDWANQAIAKANEAWEVNHDTQPVARHIKDRANEIIAQLK